MTSLTPLPPRERVVSLDILRGLALLGVMIGNLGLYSGAWTVRGPVGGSQLDEVADWLETIFVSSKAQTLLTMLFGFGFAVQLVRARAKQEPVVALYTRRMVALFGIGACHVALLWWGDVTWGYAICGFGLLLFPNASVRTRAIAAFAFIFVPYLLSYVPAIGPRETTLFFSPARFGEYTAAMGAALRAPSHAGLAAAHVTYALAWSARIIGWYPFWLLGRFLLGHVAGTQRWFERDGADHLPVFRRMLAWGIAGGALGTGCEVALRLGLIPGPPSLALVLAVELALQIGLVGMALTYVATVVLLVQRARWRRVLAVFAPVGRMPLTVYLSQSLVCTFLFYGWGLGWADDNVGPAARIGLALAIYAVQTALCHVWLRRFRFGPLEWVWRYLVYMRRP